MANPNALRWDGSSGFYEVYYLTLTDPGSGVGFWIRYTLLAPLPGTGQQASCALWLLAMDPRPGRRGAVGRKRTFPIEALSASTDPFALRIDTAELCEHGMRGGFGDVAWELGWEPREAPLEHVDPWLQRARVAQTVLVLPHGDLEIEGTITVGEDTFDVTGARGGQAHLWGSKHATSWAWAHASDFRTLSGEPAPRTLVDGVSVFVSRYGRTIGPNTPVVALLRGEAFRSTSPVRVLRNGSEFSPSGWSFDARTGTRRLIGEVNAASELLAGVTYHDPDGERAYCYNTEAASMRLHVLERAPRTWSWRLRETLVADGRAHFEYAQRTPLPELGLLTS